MDHHALLITTYHSQGLLSDNATRAECLHVCMHVDVFVCVYVCVCACMRVCMSACVRACVYVCARVCVVCASMGVYSHHTHA